MDDLISRKAAIEAVKIPNGAYSHPSIRHGIIIAREEARRAIQAIPSVSAVPLDKLCEWLAAEYVSIPCHLCDHYENGRCSVENDMKATCPAGADEWRKVLEKGRWNEHA